MKIKEIGHVQQRVNSIEKRNRKPDLRNVRLNCGLDQEKGDNPQGI